MRLGPSSHLLGGAADDAAADWQTIAHVGAGALTRPRSEAPQMGLAYWRATLARPDEGVRAYVIPEAT